MSKTETFFYLQPRQDAPMRDQLFLTVLRGSSVGHDVRAAPFNVIIKAKVTAGRWLSQV